MRGQLERATNAIEPDRQGVAMNLILRHALVAILFAVTVVALGQFICLDDKRDVMARWRSDHLHRGESRHG